MMTVAEAIAEYARMLDLLDSEPTYNKYFSEDREVLLGELTAEQQDQVLASMKMVYTYQVTLTLDLMVEPVVTYHTILGSLRVFGSLVSPRRFWVAFSRSGELRRVSSRVSPASQQGQARCHLPENHDRRLGAPSETRPEHSTPEDVRSGDG
ncbi:MAG TPA: hypothetical protein VK638_02260 [Edaphobacter sp.]|nr:hypothetical protein [Edaphobacter sp.]